MARHGLGIVCDGSQASLQQAVASLLEDHPRREHLSGNARAYAHEHHDIRRQVVLDRRWLADSPNG
jgi:hypothetical protein